MTDAAGLAIARGDAPALAPSHTPAARREWACVLAILLAAFVVNLLTAARSPVVWMDEVFFADPAAHWAKGDGFISRAWRQSDTVTWASNAPLHSMLLGPWIKVFGLSPTVVRSINFVYITAVALLLWTAARRAGWLRAPAARVALVGLVICGNAVSFSYRGGRYDTLGMLLFSGMAAAATVRRPAPRTAILVALGAAVPWAGFSLVPYAAVTGAALLLCFGRRTLWVSVPVGAGIALGGGLFVAYLKAVGGYEILLHSIEGHQNVVHLTGGRPTTLFGWVTRAGRNLVNAYAGNDPSMTVMAGLLVWATAVRVGWAERGGRRAVWFAVTIGVVVPVILGVMFAFMNYYAWKVYLPLCVVALAVWERGRVGAGWGTLARTGTGALVAGAMAVGLPARLVLTAAEWQARDFGRVYAWEAARLRPDDVAVVDTQGYYAAMNTARRAYFGEEGVALARAAGVRVTVIVCNPAALPTFTQEVGGEWEVVATLPPAPEEAFGRVPRSGYAAVVARRAATG